MDVSDCYELSHQRRELFFRVLNDVVDIHPIAHRLKFLQDHFPSHKLDLALVWLIKGNLIGKSFVGWFAHTCKGSDLEMHRILLSVVRNSELAPVIAGKDFKV